MEKQNNTLPAFGKALLKFLAGFVLFVILFFGLLLAAIRIPAVQTRVVQKASEILSDKLQHQVSVGRVDINFFKSVILDKVKVLDYKKEVLFSVSRLKADISLFSLFKPNQLHLSRLTLTQPRADLIKYAGSDSLNMTTFIPAINRLLVKKDTVSTKAPFQFDIDAITLENGRFTYQDLNKPFSPHQGSLDYQHMQVDSIFGTFSRINLGDTLGVQISGLRAREKRSGTRLHQLSTRMRYAATFWEFDDLNLRVGKSFLGPYVRFDFKRFRNFVNFNDSVQVTARLRKTSVYSDDIARFAYQLKDMKEHLRISGDVKGRVNRFTAKNVDARYGRYTHVVGNLSSHGLPVYRETFLELDLKPSVLYAPDLKRYLPANIFPLAQRLGKVRLHGEFIGFYNDFVANGSFQTALGKVESDLNLKINQNRSASSYSGFVRTHDFQLGKLLGTTNGIGALTMSGKVKGTGFDLESARLQLNADIAAFGWNGYPYRNIKTDATLSRETFSGQLAIQDPNIQLTATGDINLSSRAPSFRGQADIDLIDFQALKLSRQAIRLQTKAQLDFRGLKANEILGTGTFTQTELTLNHKHIELDSVFLLSGMEQGRRSLQFLSDLADVKATGNWQYTTLLRDLSTLVKEYRLNFESNDRELAAYYRKKRKIAPAAYVLDYDIYLKDINQVLQAFVPSLHLSDNSRIEGSFRQGPNAVLTLHGQVDTVQYGKHTFYQNELELNTSKLPDAPDVLANAILTSREQKIAGLPATELLHVEGVWSERRILFNSNLAQTGSTNKVNLNGSLAFLSDKLQVVLDNSQVNMLGQAWQFSPNNTILIAGKGREIDISDLVLSYQEQQISLNGHLSPDSTKALQVAVKNFRLENLNPLMKTRLAGILNGSGTARNVFGQPIITSKLQADSVAMDGYLVGMVAGNTFWDNNQDRLGVDLGITRDKMKVLNVTGYYNPESEFNQLDLLALMDNAPVKLVEPLLKTLFGDLGGTMAGRLKITGQLSAPALAGSAMITNGRFNFKYLNTTYTFTDRIHFTENDITFRNVKVYDVANNTGTISGSIIHQGFKDMILDLQADFRKLMVLNTTREQNKLYYGTAIATGKATVLGAPSDLVINIDARSEAGTRMFIPLDNSSTITRQNFIRFVNRNVTDTTQQVSQAEPAVDLSGINMNFNLDVTPDAYLEIILDAATGDIVRGSGNGRIKMNIDTRGEFTMEGQIEIIRGAYNFTLYNVINKEFLIRPGGTIIWNGDPYEGIMNITATYTQTVPIPPSILGATSTGESAPANIRIPVTAVMNLEGNLLTPQIKLDLEFNNTPSELETQLSPYLADIRNDQDELNRQVFSLLILKRLSERGTLGGGGSGSAVAQGFTGSLSELITNQLGNWLSQLDSNLEVDIGLVGTMDQVDLRNLQVRLSYNLMEGRLRLSREGGIGSSPDQPQNPNSFDSYNNSLAGDWRAEYFLGQNGKLRLRMEYITSQRRFATTANTSITNVSLLHTEQFNSLRDLFRRRRLQRRYQIQEKDRLILDSDIPYDQIK
ncbi:MAG: translocation/assembly module TamB domain-containing protein [Adhaeribacter sp.]